MNRKVNLLTHLRIHLVTNGYMVNKYKEETEARQQFNSLRGHRLLLS